MVLAGWLSVAEHAPDESIWVRVAGSVCGDRADELWSTLESALETAAGRMVVVDLARVTGFDLGAIEAVQAVARAVKRWRVDMRAVATSSSAISDYLLAYSVDRLIPLYRNTEALRKATEDDTTSQLLIESYSRARDRLASRSGLAPGRAALPSLTVA